MTAAGHLDRMATEILGQPPYKLRSKKTQEAMDGLCKGGSLAYKWENTLEGTDWEMQWTVAPEERALHCYYLADAAIFTDCIVFELIIRLLYPISLIKLAAITIAKYTNITVVCLG